MPVIRTSYAIVSSAGQYLGAYHVGSAAEALDALARDAGYSDAEDAFDVDYFDGTAYHSDDDETVVADDIDGGERVATHFVPVESLSQDVRDAIGV
jgi:hypothetical protein